MMSETGPIYGVPLIDCLPMDMDNGMKQAMPSREDLVRVRSVSDRTVAGYEVLLSHYRRAMEEIDRLTKNLAFVRESRDGWCTLAKQAQADREAAERRLRGEAT